MEIRFLGGAREVGRSAILVNDSLLLDYGMLTGTPPRFPVGDVSPDAVVVSHGHLDHVGALPSLLSGRERPPIHWTPPTRDLAHTLARDTLKLHGGTLACPFTETDVHRMSEVSVTHGYGESFEPAAESDDGESGDNVSDLGSGTQDEFNMEYTELETVDSGVSSLTFDDTGSQATGEFAAILGDGEASALEDSLGSSASESSVTVEDGRVTATATWESIN